jgi:GWxTD domain-containing protein
VPPRAKTARTAAALVLAAVALAFLACAGGPAGSRSAGDLINPFLSPEHSAWLVGPVAHIATPEEVRAYLALRDDAAATAFVDRFWASRNPTPSAPNNPVLDAFDERSQVADVKFSEGGVLGRRTDRGTILVLYGTPAKTGFEVSPSPRDPGIEVWIYSPQAPAGLDGKRPQTAYRFIKRGEVTVFYTPRPDVRVARPYP